MDPPAIIGRGAQRSIGSVWTRGSDIVVHRRLGREACVGRHSDLPQRCSTTAFGAQSPPPPKELTPLDPKKQPCQVALRKLHRIFGRIHVWRGCSVPEKPGLAHSLEIPGAICIAPCGGGDL